MKLSITNDGMKSFIGSIQQDHIQKQNELVFYKNLKMKNAQRPNFKTKSISEGQYPLTGIKETKEDQEVVPSPIKRLRNRSPPKNGFIEALRLLKEERLL
jgi:hypothetical protein